MKHTTRSQWVATVLIVSALMLVAAPALLNAASQMLDQRVGELEARVSDLEATVAVLEKPSTTAEEPSTLTATLEINVVGDSWEATGARTCDPTGLVGVQEGEDVIVTNLDGDEVGSGVFEAGRQVNQGCIISATLTLEESDYYYITVGLWENFEFDLEYLENNDWVITLSAMG